MKKQKYYLYYQLCKTLNYLNFLIKHTRNVLFQKKLFYIYEEFNSLKVKSQFLNNKENYLLKQKKCFNHNTCIERVSLIFKKKDYHYLAKLLIKKLTNNLIYSYKIAKLKSPTKELVELNNELIILYERTINNLKEYL